MSYEPRLVIRRNDLLLYVPILEKEQYSIYDDIADVAKFLLKVSNSQVIKIGGQEMYLCHPELTYFNELVRDYLRDMEIEFDTWN